MNIVAVYNTNRGPGFWPYTSAHIISLRNQLERVGHKLTVIGADEPLYHQPAFAGWWSKMLVYAPEYAHLRPALALDLDNFVIRSLDPILALETTKLWLIRKFLSRTHEGEMGFCTVPDSPLSDAIWQAALTNDKTKPPGDLIIKFPHEFMVDKVPGIYSYKVHCRGGCPADAMAVLFHGSPKAPALEGWALEWWQQTLAN
jgi:hypothetical protein